MEAGKQIPPILFRTLQANRPGRLGRREIHDPRRAAGRCRRRIRLERISAREGRRTGAGRHPLLPAFHLSVQGLFLRAARGDGRRQLLGVWPRGHRALRAQARTRTARPPPRAVRPRAPADAASARARAPSARATPAGILRRAVRRAVRRALRRPRPLPFSVRRPPPLRRRAAASTLRRVRSVRCLRRLRCVETLARAPPPARHA